ncbi:hypothetical protein LOK74_00030 [Brevibacillus humidisoli]|uniref:hypothetical protein n=1 Tax=Brevibacillus humidisoli TaxID=2895522 RepID=UPI001E606EBB|nr:hypothetical protein [Brevibacillus humidisoli]UFJ40992.1 hypothetical protein LOK74_00030 [Brevibacillus humidisoli]
MYDRGNIKRRSLAVFKEAASYFLSGEDEQNEQHGRIESSVRYHGWFLRLEKEILS